MDGWMYVCIYIYICIFRERESGREMISRLSKGVPDAGRHAAGALVASSVALNVAKEMGNFSVRPLP